MAKKQKIKKKEDRSIVVQLPHIRGGIVVNYVNKSETEWPGDAEAYTDIYENDNPEISFNVEKAITINAIVHECTHATLYLLGARGFKGLGDYDDESLTYHLGYVVQEVMKDMKENKVRTCL